MLITTINRMKNLEKNIQITKYGTKIMMSSKNKKLFYCDSIVFIILQTVFYLINFIQFR